MTITEIRQHIAKWEAADQAVSRNKSYTVDNLTYTRQDAEQIRAMIDYWTRRLAAALAAGKGSIRREQGVIKEWGQR